MQGCPHIGWNDTKCVVKIILTDGGFSGRLIDLGGEEEVQVMYYNCYALLFYLPVYLYFYFTEMKRQT